MPAAGVEVAIVGGLVLSMVIALILMLTGGLVITFAGVGLVITVAGGLLAAGLILWLTLVAAVVVLKVVAEGLPVG